MYSSLAYRFSFGRQIVTADKQLLATPISDYCRSGQMKGVSIVRVQLAKMQRLVRMQPCGKRRDDIPPVKKSQEFSDPVTLGFQRVKPQTAGSLAASDRFPPTNPEMSRAVMPSRKLIISRYANALTRDFLFKDLQPVRWRRLGIKYTSLGHYRFRRAIGL